MAACSRERPPELAYLGTDDTILAFGDSLTYGTGAKPEQAYPAVLEDLINRQVIKVATPGDQTQAGLRKLPGALEAHEPELVILCLGGNDFLRKTPLARTRDNLDAMLNMLDERNIPVVLIGVPQIGIGVLLGVPRPGLFGLKGHELYESLAEEYRLVLDNRSIPEILSERDLKSDAIHPNAAGYQRLVESLAALLREAGAV